MIVGTDHTNRNWRGRVIRYAPFLICTVVIFTASSSTGSAENTSRFIRPLLELIFYSAEPASIDSIHGFIRKSAHFIFYGILAVLAFRAFVGSSKRLLAATPIITALFAVFVIASVDEINQSFNPERTGSMFDVLLDMAGAVTFLVALRFLRRD